MCLKDNNAEHVTDYVKAQLESLYKIGSRCALSYSNEEKEGLQVSGYDFALAEFHSHMPDRTREQYRKLLTSAVGMHDGKQEDLLTVHATFAPPRITFLCDHEIELEINVIKAENLVQGVGILKDHHSIFTPAKGGQVVSKDSEVRSKDSSFAATFLHGVAGAMDRAHDLVHDLAPKPVQDIVHGMKDRLLKRFHYDEHPEALQSNACFKGHLATIGGSDGQDHPLREDTTVSKRHALPFRGNIRVRMPWAFYNMAGESQVLQNGGHLLQLIVLGSQYANVQDADPLKTAFAHLYLTHLHNAGHHILYSLPDFDDDGLRRQVDFSSMAMRRASSVTHYCGVSIDDINKYLFKLYVQAQWKILSNSRGHQGGGVSGNHSTFLDHYRTTQAIDGVFFEVHWQAPKIHALCYRESLLQVLVEKVVFSPTAEFKRSEIIEFKGWKIPIIVNLIGGALEGGHVVHVEIEQSLAGYYKIASSITELFIIADIDGNNPLHLRYLNVFMRFLSTTYINLLRLSGFHSIYKYDVRDYRRTEEIWTAGFEEGSASGGFGEHWGLVCRETHLGGFDHVITICQQTIEEHFFRLRKQHRWLKSFSKGSVTLEFGDFKIRLLSNRKLVFTLHIIKGAVGDQHFENWRLVFEVELEMQRDKRRTTIERVTADRTLPGSAGDYAIENLRMKIQEAVFFPDLCLFGSHNDWNVHHLSAVVHEALSGFFKKIDDEDFDIIASFPVWINDSALENKHRYTFTSLRFDTYSEYTVDLTNYSHVNRREQAAVIVVAGMCAGGELPGPLSLPGVWVTGISGSLSCGSIGLSSRYFLESRVMEVLASVNARTTLVPDKFELEDGLLNFHLSLWSEHPKKQKQRAHWTLVQRGDGGHGKDFEYEWLHDDEWRYRHQVSGKEVKSNGDYRLRVSTENKLLIPKGYNVGGFELQLSGRNVFELAIAQKDRKAEVSYAVTWSASLAVSSNGGKGLSVKLIDVETPNFVVRDGNLEDIKAFTGANVPDPRSHLRTVFKEDLGLASLIQGFAHDLESNWSAFWIGDVNVTLAHPLFTNHGHFLAEIVTCDGLLADDKVVDEASTAMAGVPQFGAEFLKKLMKPPPTPLPGYSPKVTKNYVDFYSVTKQNADLGQLAETSNSSESDEEHDHPNSVPVENYAAVGA